MVELPLFALAIRGYAPNRVREFRGRISGIRDLEISGVQRVATVNTEFYNMQLESSWKVLTVPLSGLAGYSLSESSHQLFKLAGHSILGTDILEPLPNTLRPGARKSRSIQHEPRCGSASKGATEGLNWIAFFGRFISRHKHVVTSEPAIGNLTGLCINPVHLEHPLCNIQSISRNLLLGLRSSSGCVATPLWHIDAVRFWGPSMRLTSPEGGRCPFHLGRQLPDAASGCRFCKRGLASPASYRMTVKKLTRPRGFATRILRRCAGVVKLLQVFGRELQACRSRETLQLFL